MRRLKNWLINSGLLTMLVYLGSYALELFMERKDELNLTGTTLITATLDGEPLENIEIELDGKFLGHTPAEVTLPIGEHRVILYADDPAIAEASWEFKLGGLPPKLIKGEFTTAP